MYGPELYIDRLTPTQEGANEIIEGSQPKKKKTMFKRDEQQFVEIMKKNKADKAMLTEKESDEDCQSEQMEQDSMSKKKKRKFRYKKCGVLWKGIVAKSEQSGAVLTEDDLEELNRVEMLIRKKKSRMNKKFKLMEEEANNLKEEEKQMKEAGKMYEAELRKKKAEDLGAQLRKLNQSLDEVKQDMLLIKGTLPKKWDLNRKIGDVWCRDIVKKNKALLTEKELAELKRVLGLIRGRKYRMNKKFKLMEEEANNLKEEEKQMKEAGKMYEAELRKKKAAYLGSELRKLSKSLDEMKQERQLIVDSMLKNKIVEKSKQIGALLMEDDLENLKRKFKSLKMKKYRMNKKFKQFKRMKEEGEAREEKAAELQARIQNTRVNVEQLMITSDLEMNAGMSGVNQIGENLNEEEMQCLQEFLQVEDDTVGLRSDILNDNKEDGVVVNNPANTGGCISIYDSFKEFETNANLETESDVDNEMNADISELNQIWENIDGHIDGQSLQELTDVLDRIFNVDFAKEFETNSNLETESDVDNEMNAGMSGVNQVWENIDGQSLQQLTYVIVDAHDVLLNYNEEDGIADNNPAITEDYISIDDSDKEFETNANPQTRTAFNDCVVQCASISCTNVNI